VTILTQIGVAKDVAIKVSAAAYKQGAEAKKFVSDNINLIDLSTIPGAEKKLLAYLLPKYEGAVHQNVTVPISQDQYDALVSLVYNIGPGNFSINNPVVDYLNQKQYDKAAGSFWIWRRSGKEIVQTLVDRRKAEALMFNSKQTVTNVAWNNIPPPSPTYTL
jgi:GH24 family phage-related lysozyme (muramidase)